jgi:hypothetical protein
LLFNLGVHVGPLLLILAVDVESRYVVPTSFFRVELGSVDVYGFVSEELNDRKGEGLVPRQGQ